MSVLRAHADIRCRITTDIRVSATIYQVFFFYFFPLKQKHPSLPIMRVRYEVMRKKKKLETFSMT